MRSERDRGIAATTLELGSCWSMRNSNTGSRDPKQGGTVEILVIRSLSGPAIRWWRLENHAHRILASTLVRNRRSDRERIVNAMTPKRHRWMARITA